MPTGIPDNFDTTGLTMGPAGYWLDASGEVAPGQTTPGMRDTPQARLQYDQAKDLYYTVDKGQKRYLSPYSFAQGNTESRAKGTGSGMIQTMDKGGGAFHGHPTWNSESGKFDVSLDWGKIGSLITAGVLTAGAVSAAIAPAVASSGGLVGTGEATISAGAGLPLGTTVGGAVGGPGLSATSAAATGGGLSTVGKVAKLLHAAGPGIETATNQAYNRGSDAAQLGLEANRQNIEGRQAYLNEVAQQARLGLDANSQNITGQSAFEQELMARAKEEGAQRKDALKHVYMANRTANPNVSPYNVTGGPKYSDQYRSTIDELARQGSDQLNKLGTYAVPNQPGLTPYKPYSVGNLPTPAPYKDIDPSMARTALGGAPSTLQKVGQWLGPGASIFGSILDYLG